MRDDVTRLNRSPGEIGDELAIVIRSQGGVLTRRQALDAGLAPARIRTLLRSGSWTAVERGVYLPGADRSHEQIEAHRLRVAARRLSLGAAHAASHESAALLLGLPLLGPDPTLPVLTRPPRSATDASTSRSLYVSRLGPDETWRWKGVLVTDPARTVCDLARRSLRQGLIAADAALRKGLPREALAAAAKRCAGWPGARQAAFVAQFADGHAETAIESITRLAYAQEGLPAPETQVDVFVNGRWVARVDFAWAAHRTVGEADGMGKYRSFDESNNPLVQEKIREERLRRARLEVVRNTWDEAWSGQAALARRVREHFEFALRLAPLPGVRFRQVALPSPDPDWAKLLRAPGR